jgi:beta-lactamase regulating signal transducer with metallopeptidase domain
MMLLAEAALRSSLLTIAVWLALKLLRVRNPYSQMTAWSVVLVASLAMPLLMRLVPTEALPLPAAIPLAGPQTAHAGAATAFPLSYVFLAAYLAGLFLLLARLAYGLSQSLHLLRRSRRVEAPWTEGRDVRFCADLSMPAAIGRTILLPTDFLDWDRARQRAVLAHEASHVSRGDFYLMLLAALHRAVFWFSPLSWLLHRRLAELAEITSDAAALAVSADRLSYARILIDLADEARSIPAGLAMANHATVRCRVDHILAQSLLPIRPSLRKLILIVACLAPVSLAAGGLNAVHRPQPGSEAALRSHIDQLQRGEIDDSILGVEGMGDQIRALLPQIRPEMAALGPIVSVQFQGVTQDGTNLYLVTHAQGTRSWSIHLNEDGRIQSMGFGSPD